MAEVIFSAVVGDMVGRVISLLAGQFKGQQCTEAKLRKICHMLVKVYSAVEEAKGRQITNYGTLEWLSELDDGVYQGRYLLDMVRCKEEELEDEHADKVAARPFSFSLFNPAKRVRVAACAVKSLLFYHDVGGPEEIERVVEILETISGDLKEFMMLLQNCQPIHRPLATNIFIEGQMFGRHVEKEKTINFLLHDGGPSTGGKVGVLPIVGDMGTGKTTLAQHVCDDERVRGHFPIILYSNFSYTRAMAHGQAAFVVGSKHAVRDAKRFIDSLHILKEKYLTKRFLMIFEDVDEGKKQMLEELLPKQDHNHHKQQGRRHEHGNCAADQSEGHAAPGVLVLLQGARVCRQRCRGGPKDASSRQGDCEEAKWVLLRSENHRRGAESSSESLVLEQGAEEQYRGVISVG